MVDQVAVARWSRFLTVSSATRRHGRFRRCRSRTGTSRSGRSGSRAPARDGSRRRSSATGCLRSTCRETARRCRRRGPGGGGPLSRHPRWISVRRSESRTLFLATRWTQPDGFSGTPRTRQDCRASSSVAWTISSTRSKFRQPKKRVKHGHQPPRLAAEKMLHERSDWFRLCRRSWLSPPDRWRWHSRLGS